MNEIESLANGLKEDKLLGKLKDAKDYFIIKRVEIEYFDEDMIKVRVSG